MGLQGVQACEGSLAEDLLSWPASSQAPGLRFPSPRRQPPGLLVHSADIGLPGWSSGLLSPTDCTELCPLSPSLPLTPLPYRWV